MLISRRAKLSLRGVALLYLLALLILPVVVVFFKTFEHGFGTAWGWMTTPAAVSALWLSLLMALIAVPLLATPGEKLPPPVVRDQSPCAVLVLTVIVPVVDTAVCVALCAVMVTGALACSLYWPSVTTRSPSLTPELTMVRSPVVVLVWIGRGSTVPSALTTQANSPRGPR